MNTKDIYPSCIIAFFGTAKRKSPLNESAEKNAPITSPTKPISTTENGLFTAKLKTESIVAQNLSRYNEKTPLCSHYYSPPEKSSMTIDD